LARARVIGPCICMAVGTTVVSIDGMSSSKYHRFANLSFAIDRTSKVYFEGQAKQRI
jgi:hypothetical protein